MFLTGACYIRVSTDEQTEYSPDAQLRLLRDYADKNNIRLSDDHIYTDAGISGRKADKRPAFMKMIANAKTKPKPFDVILVHKFDRFARSREDSVVYKSLLKKESGIKVISITESIEDDKFSVILEAMLEAMAEYYSLNLGEEVKKGMTEKALRGELQTPAPFGYRMADGMLCVKEDEAEIIRTIFSLYTDNNMSAKKIALEINRLGFKTIKGNYFDKRSIEYIIRNPIYAGKLRWTQDRRAANRLERNNPLVLITKGRHEAIITEGLWLLANSKINSKKRSSLIANTSCHDSEITTHWLRGLVKCSECGSVLSYGKGFGGRDSAYRCNRYLNGGCVFSQRIAVSKLEKIIAEAVDADTSGAINGYYDKISKTSKYRNNYINVIQSQVKKNSFKLAKAKELVLSGVDSPEEYKITKQALNDEKRLLTETLEKEMAENELLINQKGINEGYAGIRSFKEMLYGGEFSLTEKNAVLREIIKEIVYNRQENRIEIMYFYTADIN